MTTQGKPPTQHPTEANEYSRPLLKLIKGTATDEELAALITVVAAMSGTTDQPQAGATQEWSAHHRKVRVTLPHGRGGWRSSGLPR